jgi:hypothetical protein
LFKNNIAYVGGGIFMLNKANYSNSANCTFEKNRADLTAGAIYILFKSSYQNSPNCRFI